MAKAAQAARKGVDFEEEDEAESKDGGTSTERRASGGEGIVELDMNLEDIEDFEPLPAGAYPFSVLKAELRTADSGNEYYYQTLIIHPDDFPADYSRDNAPEGLRLTYARIQKPDPKNRRSITSVKNYLRAIGIPLKTSVIDPAQWEGKKGKVILKRATFRGDPTNEIVSVESLDTD